jgi:hypothetical protein
VRFTQRASRSDRPVMAQGMIDPSYIYYSIAINERPHMPRTGSSAAGTAGPLTTPEGESGPSTPPVDGG